MRAELLLVAILAVTALSGCVDGQTNQPLADSGAVPKAIQVASLRVGDSFVYNFTFSVEGEVPVEFAGQTMVRVVDRAPHLDGAGVARDALHIMTGMPGTPFGEEYWVDASTLRQFHLQRPDAYAEVSHFDPGPAAGSIPAQTMYGNGTGLLDRYLDDPLFEDFHFYGSFATGRTLTAGHDLNVTGNVFARDSTFLLMRGPFEADVSATGEVHAKWGEIFEVGASATYESEMIRQTVEWHGEFAPGVPLVLEADRTIESSIHGQKRVIRFQAELAGYDPGRGDALVRTDGALARPAAAPGFEAWERLPPASDDPRIPWDLSSAVAAIDAHPDAQGYHRDHPGAILDYARYEEIDTCDFYSSPPPPTCHWYYWSVVFAAPDGWTLAAQAEWQSDTADPVISVPPVVSRDYPFDVLFDVFGGQTPQPPPPMLVAAKSSPTFPDRDAYPPLALSISGALDRWEAMAHPETQGMVPKAFTLFLDQSIDASGYGYYIASQDWFFPSANPELFAAYDAGPLVLDRHTTSIGADGAVLDSRNYAVVVEEVEG